MKQQIDQGGFTVSGAADDGQSGSRRDFQTDILKGGLAVAPVDKGQVGEGESPLMAGTRTA